MRDLGTVLDSRGEAAAAAAGGDDDDDDDDDGHTPISTYLSWFRWIIGQILMIRCSFRDTERGSFFLSAVDRWVGYLEYLT